MINKLKNISFYFTCISVLFGAIFGVFKAYDFAKIKLDQIESNKTNIDSLKSEHKTDIFEFKKLKLTVKKLRLKVGNGKKVMNEIIKEEEIEIEKKRKRFLGIF